MKSTFLTLLDSAVKRQIIAYQERTGGIDMSVAVAFGVSSVVCLSVVCDVCNVLYCGETVGYVLTKTV